MRRLRINSFTFTGHSLGAALAQVCYLCFKFGALKKYGQGKEIACYLYSAPPVLTKKSVSDLKLSVDFVYHCYIDTDLVHMIDLQENVKTYILKTYNKQRANMGHFGQPIFRLSGSALTSLDFPDSHDYKSFYKLSNAVSPVADIDNKIIINQYPQEFVLHFKIDEIKEGVQLILVLRKTKNNVISYLEKADQCHKQLIKLPQLNIKYKTQLQQQLNLAISALNKLKIIEYHKRLSLLSACLGKLR